MLTVEGLDALLAPPPTAAQLRAEIDALEATVAAIDNRRYAAGRAAVAAERAGEDPSPHDAESEQLLRQQRRLAQRITDLTIDWRRAMAAEKAVATR